ncbi:hypothetical protein [Streptomyces luteolifulvus]|nr:hypothetical protein [Streptomyces luteolifulvus]
MAEALPTGTFGHARPAKPRPASPAPRWTPEEQAAHLADLNAALDGWQDPSETATRDRRRPRRLRVIDGQAA